MKIYGFIFARGGSKGVPNKNIRELGGRPLIAHAISAGRACGRLDRIIVSTDSKEIAETARRYGAEVPFRRPEELAADDSKEWFSWQHAIRTVRETDDFDVFVSLPAVAPLRSQDDINGALDLFLAGQCEAVITCAPAATSPYFNMVSLDDDHYARIILPLSPPPVGRQKAPKVYDLVPAVYVSSPDYILGGDSLWRGRVKAWEMDRRRAVDIDEPIDFEIAEFLLARGGGS